MDWVHRRALGSALVAAVMSAACFDASPQAPTDRAAGPPHIVLIVADDLGWGDVGYHGSAIRTPHLDRLRADGVELNRFYVQPSCSPTRAALLTGRYPIRYGMQSGIVRPWAESGLDLDERLLPELLRSAGYATHMVGKWHLGAHRVEELPTRRGFDHHYGMYTGKADYFTRMRDGALDWHRDGEPLREEGYTTHLLRDEALRIVRAHDPAQPLFLYLPFSAPHFPLQAPADEVAAYDGVFESADRRTYAAMVSCMDAAIGDLRAALAEQGMQRDTLIVFLSDNGASLDHGGSNGELSGGKNGIGEGGVRVPALVAWPGTLEPRRVDAPLHAVDWLPTLVGLAGHSEADGPPLDGVDLLPTLRGEAEPARDVLLLNVAPNLGALMAGPLKLRIDYVERQAGDLARDPLLGTYLYDVDRDPGETNNLAAERLGERPDLLAALARFKSQMQPLPPDRPSRLPENYPIPDAWGPQGE